MSKVKLIPVILILILSFSSDYGLAITDARDIKDIGIDEKLGDYIPGDIVLQDENNEPVAIKDLLSADTPTILNLVYYSCPKLCNFATDGLLQVVNETQALSLGEDFKILTVSFDSEDTAQLAASKAAKYHKETKRAEGTQGNWPFLIGDKKNIEKLTESVGFRYKVDGDEFAHASALIVLTPEGMISRYLHGIQHEPTDFRLSLLEASKGEIGTSQLINSVLLFCYGFDPVGKKYALKALNIVKAGGIITLLSLCVGLTFFWRREKKEDRT